MIRVNLLPRAQRRRRLSVRRDAVLTAAMLLGWAVVMSLGYVWIAGHGARAADLRARALATHEDAARVRKRIDHPRWSLRQEALRARKQALEQLLGERRTPLLALHDLAAALGGSEGAPLFAPPGAPLRLLELRVQPPSTWRLVGTARDAAALAELTLRLRAGDRFALLHGPEWTREPDDRLRFRVDLAVARWD